MTKEQEESIEYLKKHIKYFEEQIKFIEATDCDYYDEEFELYQNRVKQFNTVLFMLEEKDKIIDLMSEAINNNDIDEDICRRMGQKEECNEFEDKEKCKDCIKQYYENKAKEAE